MVYEQGNGTYTEANGNKYVGDFAHDRPGGQGTYTLADGRIFAGTWKDSEFQGSQ
ncbi:hypothetical protein FACS189449_04400 [Alphaproteobacteria bacterium]|nr:hypothetical protein FACS189449_04400 [Alphaproteobacteria bacterium]